MKRYYGVIITENDLNESNKLIMEEQDFNDINTIILYNYNISGAIIKLIDLFNNGKHARLSEFACFGECMFGMTKKHPSLFEKAYENYEEVKKELVDRYSNIVNPDFNWDEKIVLYMPDQLFA